MKPVVLHHHRCCVVALSLWEVMCIENMCSYVQTWPQLLKKAREALSIVYTLPFLMYIRIRPFDNTVAAPLKKQQRDYFSSAMSVVTIVEQRGDLLDSSVRSLIAAPPATALTRRHTTLSCGRRQPEESCHSTAMPPARQMEPVFMG